jgi:hypothetical protein
MVVAGQHHHGLQRVKSFLRYFHRAIQYAIKSIALVDFMNRMWTSNLAAVLERGFNHSKSFVFSKWARA